MKLLIAALLLLFPILPLSAQQAKQVQVVVKSPVGRTRTLDQTQTISVTFNMPMTPLKEVPQDEDTGPLVITPVVKGKYRWQGTSTLAFIPAQKLPHATAYKVTVPAGTKSITGEVLETAHHWDFETPRPQVTGHEPYHDQKYVELDFIVLVRFNQPVDPQAASRFISIEQHAGGQVEYPAYTAQRPDSFQLAPRRRLQRWTKADLDKVVILVPKQPFRKGANIVVRMKTGLSGIEGPLPMSEDYAISFLTYNEFSFQGIRNGHGFVPNEYLWMGFSNPVSRQHLVRHLKFIPSVKLEEEEYDYFDAEPRLSLPLEPETDYTGFILPGMKDQFDQQFTDTVKFKFRTGSYPPSVRMTTGQGVLEAYESHKYPVTFMNIDSVQVNLGRMSPDRIVEIMQRMDYTYYERLAWEQAILTWMDRTGEDKSEFNISMRWSVKTPRNKKTVKPLDLDAVLGKAQKGIILAQIDNLLPNQHRRYLKALVQVTNLGITAKFSPEDNLVWVSNLKDASPVAGASVEIRSDSNKVLWKGTTDANGFAKAPGWWKLGLKSDNTDGEDDSYGYRSRQPRQWLIIRYKDDVAFSSSDWNQGIEPWQFNVQYDWNPKPNLRSASLFTDRGLYKASEHVEIKGIVRELRESQWRIPPQALALRMQVRDSRNEEVLTLEPKLSPFGSFATSLVLKPTAPLGYYSIDLSVKKIVRVMQNNKPVEREVLESVGRESFRVEAFRAAEFEVNARLGRKEYVMGDTLNGTIVARYLFGGAMKNAPLSWRLSASPTSWSPEGFESYVFGPMYWLSRYSRGQHILTSDETELDANGSATMRYAMRVGQLSGPQYVTLEGDATSPSRQVMSGRGSVLVHGSDYYIGIGASTTFTSVDSTLKYKLIVADTDGKLVESIPMTMKLYRRIWRSVRKAETGGRYYWTSTVEDSLTEQTSVSSASVPVERTFIPRNPGFYFFDCTSKDRRGNTIHTQQYFYVTGSGYVAWERSNDDRIELIADKKNYKPGDVAHVIVKSPYEQAPAMVSIEREGILSHYRTVLVGSAPQIDIPIRNEYLPNVFVSVVLLQGRVEGAAITKEADVGRPSFKIGYVGLSVSPDEKQLKVTVETDKKEYRPGDSVWVNVSTTVASGKGASAEVALSVADLGVLNLIGYRIPNPFPYFYRQRGLAVTTTESVLHLIQQRDYGEKGEEEGGGGGEEAAMAMEGVRMDFRPSAYWNPGIITNAQGKARVRFKLPDNLTTFEVMAVGHTKAAEFGYGELSFQVNKPLLLQPALPRFARLGDKFEGGVTMTNYTQKEKQVKLVSSATGIALSTSDTLAFTLTPGQSKEARLSFAADKLGTATFVFRAWTDEDRDGLQWKIPVQVPRLKESVALYESTTEPEVRQKILVPKDVYTELGNLETTLASTALVGLAGGIAYLFEYPYGCLEQRLSRVLPLVLAQDIVEAFKFEVFKDKNYREVARVMLEEIPLFQRGNGGFSYWKNTHDTWPYLSAFTMYTLVQAQKHGYEVDKKVLENGFRYLREVINDQHPFVWYRDGGWACTKALILYTLALYGTPEFGFMDRMYGDRLKLPLFARAYLLKAYSVARGNTTLIAELARDLTNNAKVAQTSAHFEERAAEDDYWIFHSTARTTALTLQALVETQSENSLIPKVVRWLIDRQKTGRWRTTQENIYVVDALATYFKTYESEEPNFRSEVHLAGSVMMTELFKGRSLRTASKGLSMADLVQGAEYPLDFKKQGLGRLYYTVRMNYYPKVETKAKDEGIGVMKDVAGLAGMLDGSSGIKAGTVAKVTLTISTNQDRNFVVVDDPIPAGWEIVNTSFQTTSTAEAQAEWNTKESWWNNPFRHRELYDDRALFFADYLPAGAHTLTYLVRVTSYGTFQMPATRAEGMYEPEVFGQTGSKTVKVE